MSRGIRRFSNPRDFANKRRGNERSEKLTDIKKAGKLDTWMHTKLLPMLSYCHSIPMPTVFKDRTSGEDVRRIWSKSLVCHETIEVLEAQHFRIKDDPLVRKMPPERCALCKLVDWCWVQCKLYEMTRDDKKKQGIEFTTPMFNFENEEHPEDNLVVHIGGACNILSKKDKHSDAMKAAIKKARIRADEAFKENFMASAGYIVAVVEDEKPSKGLIVTRVGGGLGGSIQDMMDGQLENNRDIQRKPYCMRWKYDEKALPMDKYKSIALTDKKASAEVLALIRGPEPRIPDYLTEPFNQAAVRAFLEEACVLPEGTVPWDEFFPTKEQVEKWKKEDEEAAKREAKAAAEAEADDDDAEEGDDEDDADEPEFDEDGDELIECECGKPMKAKDSECKDCGREYDVEGDDEETEEEEDEEEGDEEEGDEEEEEEEEEKPAPKKKAAAPVKPKEAPKPEPKKTTGMKKRTSAKRASSSKDDGDDDDSQDAEVPF